MAWFSLRSFYCQMTSNQLPGILKIKISLQRLTHTVIVVATVPLLWVAGLTMHLQKQGSLEPRKKTLMVSPCIWLSSSKLPGPRVNIHILSSGCRIFISKSWWPVQYNHDMLIELVRHQCIHTALNMARFLGDAVFCYISLTINLCARLYQGMKICGRGSSDWQLCLSDGIGHR